MVQTKTRILGGREIEKALKQLPRKAHRNVLAGMLRAGAKPIRDEARANVARKTGLGAKSIVTRSSRTRDRNSVAAKVTVLGRAFYLRFLEFGTRFIAATPFLRPAADSKFGEAVKAMGRYAGVRIEKEAKKLARQSGARR